ncbi:hypothetical protein [Microbispora sp. NPDC049633]|uniref:hypothetical protein n=1 Tax=Microbispora sp. NPDC049633 TaxID=3154355 RepID=UPI00343839C0
MTAPSDEYGSLHELEIEVEEEMIEAERGLPEEAAALPITEWLFDPTDVERARIGLRGLLGAVEVLEDDLRPAGPVE